METATEALVLVGGTDTPIIPDAVTPDHLAFLRTALNTASKDEVHKMIQDELLDYHQYGKIELRKGNDVIILPEAPRHYLFPEILTAVDANIPTALIGPAGSGKSTVVSQIAEALQLPYYLQNSVSGTHELAGYMDAHGRYNTTAFRSAFEKGGVILVDEVDTSDAGALKWLNTALANGHAMFPDNDTPVQRSPLFRMIIAANTFGTGADRLYVGANQLDASTLDRFVFFDFGYDEQLETLLSGNNDWVLRVQSIRAAAAKERARVVISPRASIYGSKLLSLGWDQKIVEERLIWKGMDTDLKDRILASIPKGAELLAASLSRKQMKDARRKMWAKAA